MIKKYKLFIEGYSDKIKDDLSLVVDMDKRNKDIADITSKMDDTEKTIQSKKDSLNTEIERLQKLQIDDFTEENKKLVKDKIEKLKSDIKDLETLVSNLKTNLDTLKK
jgi:archaellum component FlaC